MISKMKTAGAATGPRDWAVYILRCRGGTLYTGIAKNVEARLKQHRTGKGAAYTRSHLPVKLVYRQDGYTRSAALAREAAIKTYPREKKKALLRAPRPPRAGSRKRRKSSGSKS